MKHTSQRSILLAIPTITSYHTFLKELMGSLAEDGWDVHLACSLNPIPGFDSYDEAVVGTAHDVAFPRGANPLGHLRAALSFRKLVTKIGPHLIHCHFGVTAFTAALARRSRWPPCIATIQGLFFPQGSGWRRWFIGACECWSQLRMTGTWVLTECDLEAFASLGIRRNVFLQESKGFGCRLDLFDRANFWEEESHQLRRSLGIQPDDFVFVFVGRQVEFKGFNLAVRAFRNIAGEHPQAKLLLVGERDPLHPTGLQRVEEKAVCSSSGIISVGWQRNVARYLALAHVNVFPSSREGIPVNLMESLAMGVPVITSNSRGCRDVVRHGIDGLVLRRSTVEELADAMQHLLRNDALRREMIQNALADRGRFDRKSWIGEQMGIYERILAGSGRSQRTV